MAVLSAFALWPLAVLELAPRILHHTLTALAHRKDIRPAHDQPS